MAVALQVSTSPSAASPALAEAMYASGCIPVSRRRIGTGSTRGHQSATPAVKNDTCSSRWTSGCSTARS